ncbi:hypothetical protein ACFLQL_00830 [Verrucomicrobiota bacterium]
MNKKNIRLKAENKLFQKNSWLVTGGKSKAYSCLSLSTRRLIVQTLAVTVPFKNRLHPS